VCIIAYQLDLKLFVTKIVAFNKTNILLYVYFLDMIGFLLLSM